MDLLEDAFPFSKTALKGKHALVFGASKGIGAATAKMMAMAGADVTMCARNETTLAELKSEMKKFSDGNINYCSIDLEQLSSIETIIDKRYDVGMSA